MSKIKDFLTNKIRNRYRLIIRTDTTLQERVSVVLTPLNVILILSGVFVIFLTLFILIIPRSPLKSLMPGYDAVRQSNEMEALLDRVDSLETRMAINNKKEQNLLAILKGDTNGTPLAPGSGTEAPAAVSDYPEEMPTEPIDPMLSGDKKNIAGYAFFQPVKGVVTDTFNHRHGHLAVDIASYNNASVKAVLEGSVIISAWTPETGNIMVIQHKDDLLSVYKHNSVLLKKEGTFVSAGEVIALVGNSGEESSGPHLHFELWYDGVALDPLDYIQIKN